MASKICPVCKMTHTGEVSKMLTKAYIRLKYAQELDNGGNGTTLALRLGERYGTPDYFHVIHAVNQLNRGNK